MARTAAAKLYESDYYTWALKQAQALRHGRFTELDLANLVDEVEDMAKGQERELESRLIVLLAHLLKWAYEPEARSKSWRLTIKEQRLQTKDLLAENPGIKPKARQVLTKAYRSARLEAAKETPLEEKDFPGTCPWTREQAIDDEFFPEVALSDEGGNHQTSRRRRRGSGGS